jgi:hypothetical protein
MLNFFLDWAKHIDEAQTSLGVEAKVTESEPSDNSSARLDIDTPTAVARITCWCSGEFHAEVIDLDTEQMSFSSHGVFRSDLPIAMQVAPFVAALGIDSMQ